MQDRKPTARRKPLATRGRTIHRGQSRHFDRGPAPSGLPRSTDIVRPPRYVGLVPITDPCPAAVTHFIRSPSRRSRNDSDIVRSILRRSNADRKRWKPLTDQRILEPTTVSSRAGRALGASSQPPRKSARLTGDAGNDDTLGALSWFLARRNIHGTFKQTWFALFVKTTLVIALGRGRCDSPHQGAGLPDDPCCS